MVISADLNGKITYLNKIASEIFGYKPDEVIGKSSPLIFFEEKEILSRINSENKLSGKDEFQAFTDHFSESEENNSAWTGVKKDGKRFPLILNIVNLEGENGSKSGYIFLLRDRTVQNFSMRDIRAAEDKFKRFMNYSPSIAYQKDSEGHYVFMNDAMQRIFNLDVENMQGKTDFDWLPEELARSIRERDKTVLATGEMMEFMNIIPTPDGIVRTWHTYKFPIYDSSNTAYIGVVAFDITGRMNLENELKKARDTAIESARLKAEFLANMSHEIRTPMNGVIGMTEMLLSSNLDEKQREYADIIKNSADGLLTIINDILDFSKIEAGKLKFEIIDFDLINTIETTVELFGEQAQRKNIQISSQIEPEVETCLRGDPGRLRQILINLIGNAVKFTENGQVSVRVSKIEESKNKCKLKFFVSDTGIGIDKDSLKYLFQAFTQADGSMTRKYGGTGLGLAISKQLIELMNGEVGVTSEVGKGSEFSFTAEFEIQKDTHKFHLPKINKEVLEFVKNRDRQQRSGVPGPFSDRSDETKSRGKILLAEDNIVNQKVARLQIEQLGYDLDIVSNGLDAVQAVQKAEYNLILMDCQMPEMDGYTAGTEIRKKLFSGSQIPIIAMTGHAMRGEYEKCIAAGMSDYISKPVKIGVLEKTLNKWLCDNKNVNSNNGEKKHFDGEIPNLDQSEVSLDSDILNSYKQLQTPDMPDFVDSLVKVFISNSNNLICGLKTSITNRNKPEILKYAHTLKSSGAGIGAVRLSGLCQKLEENSDSALRINEIFSEIENELAEVTRLLNEKI